jgi:nanoRNase/pAp phosphatase (c-di-AMP/oligoRNAs hydrolase)
MADVLVIYHGDCTDGFTAAWAFHTLRPAADAAYWPAKHGDSPPDVTGQEVYIVDFAYPRPVLAEMHARARSLLVLDHHKTAQADLEGLTYAVFDMDRSGAGIAWDYFAEGRRPRPWLVDVVEDRDLWRYRYGDETRYTSAYINTLPMTFEAWDELVAGGPEQVANKGAAILRYIDTYGEKAVQHAVFREIAGHIIPIINITPQNSSDHIDKLLKRYPTYPFAASFFLRGDGQWQFSLRARGDFDVSDIARQFGGGGHKSAAGFVVPSLPWTADGRLPPAAPANAGSALK